MLVQRHTEKKLYRFRPKGMKNVSNHCRGERDPVCGKRINRNKAHMIVRYKGFDYLLCCPLCQSHFEKNPEKYIRVQ